MPMSVRFSGAHLRRWIIYLTLISHWMITLGFPLSSPTGSLRTPAIAYPCQNGPCGCVSAELCWAGDCCCYTLEEKLAWADANGIVTPAHVRPMVEARKKNGSQPSKKTCCEADSASAHATANTCCDQHASTPCCDRESAGEAVSDDHGEQCCRDATEGTPKSLEKPTFRWVVGLYASKCRGDKPTDLVQLVTTVIPDFPTRLILPRSSDSFDQPLSEHRADLSHTPPSPPPRSC